MRNLFCNLQSKNNLKNIPKELEDLEFYITHVKYQNNFNFKTSTFVRKSKQIKDYKIGDIIIPNGGNPGEIVDIDISNELLAKSSSNRLHWHSVYNLLQVKPSIYEQFK